MSLPAPLNCISWLFAVLVPALLLPIILLVKNISNSTRPETRHINIFLADIFTFADGAPDLPLGDLIAPARPLFAPLPSAFFPFGRRAGAPRWWCLGISKQTLEAPGARLQDGEIQALSSASATPLVRYYCVGASIRQQAIQLNQKRSSVDSVHVG